MSDIGKIGDKALVKKTGEEAKIKKSWGIKTINISIDLDGDNLKEAKSDLSVFFTKEFDTEKQFGFFSSNIDLPPSVNKENPKEFLDNWFYELDNGDKVTKDDVITGVEDIRDYKINQLK